MDLSQFTPATWVGASLALMAAAAIIGIGIAYLLVPASISRGFGFRTASTPEAIPWQHIKGPRDIASGLVGVVMLLFFGPVAAAAVMLVEVLIPIGDALMIIRNRGSLAAALGIHLATAAVMVAAAVLLLV